MAVAHLDDETLAALPVPADAAQAYYWDDEVRGFGCVVGRGGSRTFVVRGYVGKRNVKRTIGVFGERRPDGRPWTVELARAEAPRLIRMLADGSLPPTTRSPRLKRVSISGVVLEIQVRIKAPDRQGEILLSRTIDEDDDGTTVDMTVNGKPLGIWVRYLAEDECAEGALF